MRLYTAHSKLYKRKKEEGRRKIFISALIIIGIALILAGLIWGILKLPLFKIKSVEITGLKPPSDTILSAKVEDFFHQNYFVSKIVDKNNIFFWKENSKDFLENHPEYASLKINKDFFNHKITLEAKEREKFGLWCSSSNTIPSNDTELSLTNNSTSTENQAAENNIDQLENLCWWFDKEGIAFSLAPAVESELFNRVNDFSRNKIDLGKKVLSDEKFSHLTKIYEILEKMSINSKTLHIAEMNEEEATVISLTDPKIYFSLHEDPSFAIYPIQELKNNGKWKNLQYVDLRVANRAYYK